jgi:hypothetical protein
VIAQTIANTLSARDMVVETVFITDFKFSPAFASRVESKVVAFQKYLTEQNNLKAVQVVYRLQYYEQSSCHVLINYTTFDRQFLILTGFCIKHSF